MPGWQVNSSWRVTRIGNLSASFLIYAKIDGQKSAGRRICLRHRRSGGNGRQVRFLSVLVFGLVDRFSALHVRLMLGSVCLAEHFSRRSSARRQWRSPVCVKRISVLLEAQAVRMEFRLQLEQ